MLKSTGHLSVHHCSRSSVKWIERISTINNVEHIFGFNDNYFVISRSDNGEIIYEHNCGGRHRHWDCSLIKNQEDCKMRLAFIKRKQVNCVEFHLNCSIFGDDDFLWHTRVSNVIQMIDDVKILVSGGEDTIIKIFKVEMMNDDVSLKGISDVNSHISSVKAMTMWKCALSGNLMIVSAGGRAQIVVSRVVGMTYVKEEVNFMLTNSMELGNAKVSTFDPETRFTSLDFDRIRNFLFVACSDGYLRVFEFTGSLLKLKVEYYYGKCILKVKIVENFVLTMATDGNICFHRIDDIFATPFELHHNRNGINAFDVYRISEHHFKIATGGDDCGIYVTEFELDEKSVKFMKTASTYSAHIAQITGIKFSSANEIFSVGIDQTICKLRVDDDDDIKVVDKKFTCVADVKGFSFHKDLIFIHGAGLEMIKMF